MGQGVVALLTSLGGAALITWLATHAEDLNKGEENTRLTQPGDTWDGDPVGKKRRGGPGSDPNAAAAVSRMIGMGWTKEQASGLVANFWNESLLDPHAVGDNGHAYGIGQWHEDRQEAFKKLFGIDIRKSTLDQQLQFANYELTQGNEQPAGRRLRAASNALDAGAIVSRYYERPGKKDDPSFAEQEAQKRARAASDLYASLGRINAAQIAQQSAAASSSVSNSVNTSNTTTSEAHIGNVNVYTQATDASGIARDFARHTKSQFMLPQANTGLS
nr:phage tail tip lysozyme [Burkholderia cenocepacia]